MVNVRAMQASLRVIADSIKSGSVGSYDGYVLDRIAEDLSKITARDLLTYQNGSHDHAV